MSPGAELQWRDVCHSSLQAAEGLRTDEILKSLFNVHTEPSGQGAGVSEVGTAARPEGGRRPQAHPRRRASGDVGSGWGARETRAPGRAAERTAQAQRDGHRGQSQTPRVAPDQGWDSFSEKRPRQGAFRQQRRPYSVLKLHGC